METETKRTPGRPSLKPGDEPYRRGYATGYARGCDDTVAKVVKWLHDEPFRGLLLSDPLRKAADALESGEWKGEVKT
jgi:hypothetical protein